MAKNWINQDGKFSYSTLPSITQKLPSAVYELSFDLKTGFYLEHISDSFRLPSKIYDNEKTLIDRVKNTFKNFNQNFGILLKGTKGTGKTVTAKQICNDLNLPVILVTSHFGDISTFIHSIDQDVVIFFDEFEKTYSLYGDDDGENNSDSKPGIGSLLTLMDGVFTNDNKRLFILTTNQNWIPDAMISRPSRIRYAKDFTDLSREAINEILNDIVKNKALIPDILIYLKHLEIITVDIVKSIAEEVNLYNDASIEFLQLMNVKVNDEDYNLVMINKDGSETVVIENTRIPQAYLARKGYSMWVDQLNGQFYGTGEADVKGNYTFHQDNNPKKAFSFKICKVKKIHHSMEVVF